MLLLHLRLSFSDWLVYMYVDGWIDVYTSVCMYVHTCYVLIKSAHPIYYVLAVFASCFYVLKSLLHV